MPQFAHGTWVFVGDGQKALFLINEGDAMVPNLRCLSSEEHQDPPSREQGSDAPGRAFSSVGEIRSAVANTDWHELEKVLSPFRLPIESTRRRTPGRSRNWSLWRRRKFLAICGASLRKRPRRKSLPRSIRNLTNHTIYEIERLLTAQ
jgi:hypothetical protein